MLLLIAQLVPLAFQCFDEVLSGLAYHVFLGHCWACDIFVHELHCVTDAVGLCTLDVTMKGAVVLH